MIRQAKMLSAVLMVVMPFVFAILLIAIVHVVPILFMSMAP